MYLRFERGKVVISQTLNRALSVSLLSAAPRSAFPGTNLPSAVSLQGRNSSHVTDTSVLFSVPSARGSRAQTAQTVANLWRPSVPDT